jgi:glycosyltransferase involved in cell wall biosynthesis
VRTPKDTRVVVVSELYWPEDTSTGFFVTGIAEGLAEGHEVVALCARPTYSRRGARVPERELRRGVRIERVRSTTFSHQRALGRVLNALTVTLALFLRALAVLRRGDRALVVTNPPLLPYAILLAARLRGSELAVLLHDVYPEVLEATGLVRPGGPLARVLRLPARALYRGADRVVALGPDMAAIVRRHLPAGDVRLVVIPNWCDCDQVAPEPRSASVLLERLGRAGGFVVQHLGNLGRTHAIEALVEAAGLLHDRPDVHWLFVGWGSRRAWLERLLAARGLDNVTLLPPCSAAELSSHLAACDLAVIALLPGMAGVSVPSRLYNVLASGRPLLAVADDDSELCRLVRDEGVGWTARPDAPEAIAAAVRAAAADQPARVAMGERARLLAEARYARPVVLEAWRAFFAEAWR